MDTKHLTEHARKESVEGVYSEAFRKAALADYDLTRIPGIEKLRENAITILNADNGLKASLIPLEAELADHTKREGDEGYRPKAEVRADIKKIEANIRKHEEFVLQCDEEIVAIKKGAQTNKQVAANLIARVKFLEEYTFDIADLPTATPEEAVQPVEKIHDPKTADQPLNPEKARTIEGAVGVAEHKETTPEDTVAPSAPAEVPAA